MQLNKEKQQMLKDGKIGVLNEGGSVENLLKITKSTGYAYFNDKFGSSLKPTDGMDYKTINWFYDTVIKEKQKLLREGKIGYDGHGSTREQIIEITGLPILVCLAYFSGGRYSSAPEEGITYYAFSYFYEEDAVPLSRPVYEIPKEYKENLEKTNKCMQCGVPIKEGALWCGLHWKYFGEPTPTTLDPLPVAHNEIQFTYDDLIAFAWEIKNFVIELPLDEGINTMSATELVDVFIKSKTP